MHIRSETIADFAAITELHIRAFDNRSDEAVIVSLLRQRPSYDIELSLVAEIDRKVAGHALFTPCTIMLNGQEVRAVVLAPIGVHPDFQKQGIGGKLIAAGHDIAREKGFPLSFLIGHKTYYPRFGYQTWAFGHSFIDVNMSSFSAPNLDCRSPLQEDIPALHALWMQEESKIDYAFQNDKHLSDWLSPNPAMSATVYLQDGEIVGYSRGNAESLRMFLAKNHDIARMMAKQIAATDTLRLPLHSDSASIGAFDIEPKYAAWEAAMVCPLVDNPPLPEAERLVGRPIWPSAFDLA